MAARVRLLADGGIVAFRCPGCGRDHALNVGAAKRPRWTWNGDAARPTITPSINNWGEFGAERAVQRCHSFVRDGRIQFLADSTHALRGQTVDLPKI